MLLATATWFLAVPRAQAQINIDTSFSAEYLVDTVLAGNGARIGNVRMQGLRKGIAYVKMDKSLIGIEEGILISTGAVLDAAGPNKSTGTSSLNSDPAIVNYDDAYLSKAAGFPTYDVMVLEFDFVPFHNYVSFNYCFASEEYLEYVGSKFNDVFAFLLYNDETAPINLAKVPGSKTVVAVNSINPVKNAQYYVNNTLSDSKTDQIRVFYKMNKKAKLPYIDSIAYPPGMSPLVDLRRYNSLEYDGMTTLLTAEAYVVPYKKYHMRICIADVGDYNLDSGVFLKGNSFSSVRDTTQPGFIAYEEKMDLSLADSLLGKPAARVAPQAPAVAAYKSTVYFAHDSQALSPAERKVLQQTCAYFLAHPETTCMLEGHTDNKGSETYNVKLSQRRVQAVKDFLLQQGLPAAQIQTVYFGLSKPAVSNESESTRALNRRVEIYALKR